MKKLARFAVAAAVMVALAVLSLQFLGSHESVSATPTTTLGMDAEPSQSPANTATSLGSIESCISVATDDSFDIDIFITDVPPLRGWVAYFNYDGAVINVTAVNVQMFQAANAGSLVVNVSDLTPDGDGEFYVGATDLNNVDSGTGVLARLTLQAVGPGLSPASLVSSELSDVNDEAIGDTNGDRIFDGPVLNAQIAVDQACPGGCEPDVDTDGDGFDDDVECYLGTDPLDPCPDDPSDDAWPLDIDMSTDIDVSNDVFNYVGRIGATPGDPLWWQRLDLDWSGDIDVSNDVFMYVGRIGETCS